MHAQTILVMASGKIFFRPDRTHGEDEKRRWGNLLLMWMWACVANCSSTNVRTSSNRSDGAALEVARRTTFPELSSESGRARLVVLAAEVGGRWSGDGVTALVKARAQEVPLVMQGRAETAWARWWSAVLACTAAGAFSVSLLDRRNVSGTHAEVPSVSEVMRESRFM